MVQNNKVTENISVSTAHLKLKIIGLITVIKKRT